MDVEGVQKVAIVGAGTMGPGLAQVHAAAGHPISLFSRSPATLDRGFYDCAGRALEDVLAERDDASIDAFAAAGDLTRQPAPRS